MLGAILECHTAEGVASGRIVETEAYLGEHDPACHAAVGRTARTGPLYGPPGTSYVYFIYGMYWCVNAVTRDEGLPSAVLIRALEPLDGLELMWQRRPAARCAEELTNGPARLCRALGITGKHNGLSLQLPPLLVRRGRHVSDDAVAVTPRVGISKATDWPLRWLVADSPYVSGRRARQKTKPGR
jgi:DNA-3-methyladenine glycosylase